VLWLFYFCQWCSFSRFCTHMSIPSNDSKPPRHGPRILFGTPDKTTLAETEAPPNVLGTPLSHLKRVSQKKDDNHLFSSMFVKTPSRRTTGTRWMVDLGAPDGNEQTTFDKTLYKELSSLNRQELETTVIDQLYQRLVALHQAERKLHRTAAILGLTPNRI
jgi:hypothetical protein